MKSFNFVKSLLVALPMIAAACTVEAREQSMADGKHYTDLSSDGRAIVKYRYQDGKAVDTLLNLNTVRPEEGLDISKVRIAGYELSQDEERILLWADPEYIYRRSYKADYYYYVIQAGGVKRNLIKRLTEGKVQASTLAPDGRSVVFMRDNNLYLVKVMTAGIDLAERQITDDGERNKVINGVPDWVYEEEFSMDRAIAWSPDSKMVCWLRWDESPVREYYLPTYKGSFPSHDEYELYPGQYTYKYPKAGETNATVSVWSYDVFSKKTKKMNVPVDADGYIPRLQFTTVNDKLAVLTLNRLQNTLSMYFVNPTSGVAKLALKEETDCYIGEGDLDCVNFDALGFTWASSRSGYRHIYYYNMLGAQQRQITKGDFDVTDFYGYDAKTKTAYVQTAYVGKGAKLPAELTRGIYKIDAKGTMIPLFNGGKDGAGCRGTHSAIFSKGFTYMQHYYTDAETPMKVTNELVNGLKVVSVIRDNKDQLAKAKNLAKREFFQFTTSRGDKLNGWMVKPSDGGKHPCIMFQYGGPGSQQVMDRWQQGVEQQAVEQGFVYACVDGRGTGARGQKWEQQTYCKLGVKEAEDQIAAGQYMAQQSFVDGERMGIWGWSFGGYNTLMTLCEGTPVYKAGVAVAPVTDFKFYDTVYTERYMRTPQQNATGYAASSVMNRAKNLQAKVLIVCGTADDNVHPQNTYELTDKLVELDKDFDMMVYTNRDHGIRGGNYSKHVYGKVLRYFKQNL